MEKSIRESYTPSIERMVDAAGAAGTTGAPDRRDGAIYSCDDALHLAAETALTTGRPLLLRGEPGTGKSSFAAWVARNLNRRYYEYTVTSETRAQDLLWQYDAVRRLSDAQARKAGDDPLDDVRYVEPGVLWWVFDPEGAPYRGSDHGLAMEHRATDPYEELNAARDPLRSVVLIDELDKADPDVPNGLLVPIGSSRFEVKQTGTRVVWKGRSDVGAKLHPLLVVITTNEERQLPAAFIRRCVVHRLRHPDRNRLVEIATLHLMGTDGKLDANEAALCGTLADRLIDARKKAREDGWRPPSTAEYLDAVHACRKLEIDPQAGDAAWEIIRRSVFRKADVSDEDEDGA